VNVHLSKVIPQHVSRQDFTWIRRDFALMDHDYRAIRAKVGGGMERCDWCEYAFADGDMMALAGRPAGRNWMLCQTCAQMAARPAPETGTDEPQPCPHGISDMNICPVCDAP
jgi:hypothetical protein